MPLGSKSLNVPSSLSPSTRAQEHPRLMPAILSRKRKAEQLSLSDLDRYYPVSEASFSTSTMAATINDNLDSDSDNDIELGAIEEFSISSSSTSSCSSPASACEAEGAIDEQENNAPSTNRHVYLNCASANMTGKQMSATMSRQPLSTLSNASTNTSIGQKRVLGLSQVGNSNDNNSGNSNGNTKQQLLVGNKRLRLRSEWAQFRECQPRATTVALQSTSPDSRDKYDCPLPELRWADRDEVWRLIRAKERAPPYLKPIQVGWLQRQHPCVTPKMRSVLLDWLCEVCDVHKMHRETMYLAIDFFDRVMAASVAEPKNRLQLIGVTCLFVASKVEEIYPPKVTDFAYVTDGACTEDEILSMELLILKKLRWALSPITPNAWLKLYMQITHACLRTDKTIDFLTPSSSSSKSSSSNSTASSSPSFSGLHFSRVMQLLDLCHLEVGVLSHSPSVLAASALAHFDGPKQATYVSRYPWNELAVCYSWMAPFAAVVKRRQGKVQDSSALHKSGNHGIQTHAVDLNILDEAMVLMQQLSPVSGSNQLLNLSLNSDKQGDESAYMTPENSKLHLSSDSGVFMTPQTPSEEEQLVQKQQQEQRQHQHQQQLRRSRQRRL